MGLMFFNLCFRFAGVQSGMVDFTIRLSDEMRIEVERLTFPKLILL